MNLILLKETMSFQRLFIVQLLQKCFDSSPPVKFGLMRVLYKVMPQAHVRTTLIQGLELIAKARGLWDFCQHHSKKDASFSSILLYFIGTVNRLHDSQERSSEIATWSIHFHPSITDATRHGVSCLFLFTEFVKRFLVFYFVTFALAGIQITFIIWLVGDGRLRHTMFLRQCQQEWC